MLRRTLAFAGRNWRAVVLYTVIFVAVLLMTSSSHGFQYCIEQTKNQGAYAGLRKDRTSFHTSIIRLQLNEVCSVYVFDANKDAINVFAAIVVAIFTGTLWNTSRIQGRMLKRSVEDASMASEIQLRAWVFVKVNTASLNAKVGMPFSVNHIVHNTGVSPAIVDRFGCKVAVLPYPLREGFRLPAIVSERQEIVIGPQQIYDAGIWKSDTPLTQKEIADCLCVPPLARVYFFGHLSYTNVFSRMCKTKFCFSLISSSILVDDIGNPVRATWEPVPWQNEYD